MKKIDDLISKGYLTTYGSFKELKDGYFSTLESIENYKNKKLEMENDTKFNGLSIQDVYNIYLVLGYAHQRLNVGFDINNLKKNFTNANPELLKYIDILYTIKTFKNSLPDELRENIDFSKFGDKNCDEHNFIKSGENLICAKCLASTKDYDVTKEDVEFLILCAKAQGLFMQDVQEKDIPLYNLLMQEHYEIINQMDKEDPDYSENRWMDEESILNDVCRKIKIANMMDRKEYKLNEYRTINPEYFTRQQFEKLLISIEKDRNEIMESNSNYKKMLLETCNVVMYELLILKGNSIMDLFEKVNNDEEEITALAKAYYNLSSADRRVKSGYFKDEKEAIWYECLTAEPTINEKIKEMKLRK